MATTIQQIKTEYVFPPIPDRSWDWAAWLAGQEDEGMLIGRGPTKPAAIADLIEQLSEDSIEDERLVERV